MTQAESEATGDIGASVLGITGLQPHLHAQPPFHARAFTPGPEAYQQPSAPHGSRD